MLCLRTCNSLVWFSSLESKAIIHEFKEECAVWSCVWNTDDHRYFYCGLSNGKIGIYDIRKTGGRIGTLEFSNKPVIHLAHMNQRPGHPFSVAGLLATSLSQCAFFHQLDKTMVNHQKYMVLESVNIYSAAFDRSTRLVAVSCRPDK